MASLGFQPSDKFDSTKVEYFKHYADRRGRMARATVIFTKGIMGFDHAKLADFIITTQAHIPAIREAVKGSVPDVMEEDLLYLTATLGGAEVSEPQSIVQIPCSCCHKSTPEYFMDPTSETPLCPDCFRNRPNDKRS
jgi:hypothetical protein